SPCPCLFRAGGSISADCAADSPDALLATARHRRGLGARVGLTCDPGRSPRGGFPRGARPPAFGQPRVGASRPATIIRPRGGTFRSDAKHLLGSHRIGGAGSNQGGELRMKVTVERADLLRSLSHVHRVVERRNTIPILANVLVRADRSQL